ncbi:putative transporter [Candidatus Pelagibacter sp.]|jgi:peptide/bleomycin uptake transporter|nr:putative transporter [Candidatus Pelagibacter sp.]|tara:strand:+ start:4161 stop:5156 length:996 start_codon:yes stop_codon:yes gene_type:complete
MFKFFTSKNWYPWSILGSIFILVSTWYQVQLDVKINQWFGEFYDTLQKALTTPGSVTEVEFISYLFTFARIAGLWIIIAIITGFFVSHWIFRWRTSMADYYHLNWKKARLTEGASQRVQEDTLKFARIMEGLGVGLLDSIMTLIAFLPILWGLSKQVTMLPWIGEVDHALVWVAIISALGGTILLASVGIKLPGIEYDIQKEEAAYRKELVLGEEDPIRAAPPTIGQLYTRVRKIHFKSYFHYLYFNAVKWSYFQGMVIVPYLALAPTIVTGAITLGFVQQITRAFGRVEGSLQYLVKSWSTIVELISVWKRLREFETKLNSNLDKDSVLI